MSFEDAEFAGYAEQRCPCVLVLDTAGSMQREAIDQLAEELAMLGREPAGDRIAAKRVDIAVLIIDDEVETVSVRCSCGVPAAAVRREERYPDGQGRRAGAGSAGGT